MITKKRMSPDVRFFCYICPVGFDFMLPCRFIGFPAWVFYLHYFYSYICSQSEPKGVGSMP